jgi:hypothetical protein
MLLVGRDAGVGGHSHRYVPFAGQRVMGGADLRSRGESSALLLVGFGTVHVRGQQISQCRKRYLLVGIVQLDVARGRQHDRSLAARLLARRGRGRVAGVTVNLVVGSHG